MIQAIVMVLQLLAISVFATACSSAMNKPPPPDALIVPKDVATPLPVQCQDKREPKSVLPDLSKIPADDYEAIGRAGRATIDLLTVDLLAADKQIEACKGK